MIISSEKSKQPTCIEMPFSFICSHCKKETAKLTTKEELKESLVPDTKILVEYIEDTETFEGNWFEITDDMKKGLKIACCTCEASNDGVKIYDGQQVEYLFIDDDYKDGIRLQSVVKINSKDVKKEYRVQSVRILK